MNVASGDGDETAPAGMRRAAFEAEFLEQHDEPVDDAVRLEVSAATGADDWSFGSLRTRHFYQGASEVGVHGYPPTAALLGDDVANMDRAGNLALGIEHHRPVNSGNFAGPEAGFDGE